MSDGFEFPKHKDIEKENHDYEYHDNGGSNVVPEIEPNKKKSNNIFLIVLLIILIGAVGYIAYDEYLEYRIDRDQMIVQSVVNEIAELAVTCQQVPLPVGDSTLNLVAVDCLNVVGQDG